MYVYSPLLFLFFILTFSKNIHISERVYIIAARRNQDILLSLKENFYQFASKQLVQSVKQGNYNRCRRLQKIRIMNTKNKRNFRSYQNEICIKDGTLCKKEFSKSIYFLQSF